MTLLAHRHGPERSTPGEETTGGALLDRGWRYDLEVWLFDTFLVGGKIRALRQEVLDRAQLHMGQSILDVGCGTGSLAIAAAARVGPTGRVVGIDPAPSPDRTRPVQGPTGRTGYRVSRRRDRAAALFGRVFRR
jgi:SAM-dependent methyltransferase